MAGVLNFPHAFLLVPLGDVDFMKELELMKAETGMPGSIKFGGSSFKALDAEVSANMSAKRLHLKR